MAKQSRKALFPTAIDHPTAGHSTLDPSRLAIRWRAGTTDEQREALLEELGLVPVALEGAQRPVLAINRTEGLWWVQTAGNVLSAETVQRLEASDVVEWVGPAYRAGDAATDEGTRYTVNPTRLYVIQESLEAMGGVAAFGPGVVIDTARAKGIPGLVALRVEQPSASEGRTALHIVGQLEHAQRAAVRLENIPYLSPTACPSCSRGPATELVPDDPLFASQWGLQRIGAPRGWGITTGNVDVTVAVIDEGVELGHPDLQLHPQSWNASTDTPDGSPTDNHGTACAGIAGALLDNARGVAGLAGGVRVMAIATATWADIDIAEGLYFATDNGAHVVSMSFGVYPSWNSWDFGLIRDALQHAHDAGLVLVAATGNEDIAQSRFPGSDARTIGVGGSNRDDERKRIGDASSESLLWGANYGPDLDVVAPCLEIPTTDRLGAAGYVAADYFDRFNGTSAATPHVAGLAGLILSLRPTLSNVEVRAIIESTADKISPSLYAYSLIGAKPNGTWNEEVGYGRINVERALLAACAAVDGELGGCRGCGGECSKDTPEECRAPAPVPWLPSDRCMLFYESRFFDADPGQERRRLQVRVSYEHCLRLVGRQQGPLLYTTTLLPGEQVDLFEFDRYRRVRSETEQVSVQSSFRQTLSALSQTRRSASSSAYLESLTDVRSHSDTSISAGGGLAGFFGAPSVQGEFAFGIETTVASGSSVRTASEQFSQIAAISAQSTEAERSLVISRFEDTEHQDTTRRTLRNDNECYAVTYFVRRVNEVYEALTRIVGVEWRLGDDAWRTIDDLAGLPDDVGNLLDRTISDLPRNGEEARTTRQIILPTDGTLYEPELAHCSSCEPTREEAMRIELEQARLRARRACLETELLALELRRREALLPDAAIPLELGLWPLERVGTTAALPMRARQQEIESPAG